MRACVALLVAASLTVSEGKVVDGVITLSSQETEVYLAKFSFSPHQVSRINGTFHTDSRDYFDAHQHELTLALYSDAQWPKFRHAMLKGSLCKERRALASFLTKITPGQGVSRRQRQNAGHYFDFDSKLTMPKARSHYWYAMLMDCYLEEYDAHPPPLRFEIVLLNGKSHLPADESGMQLTNGIAIVAMLIYGVIYGLNLYSRWQKEQQAHLITLLFGAAYALQALSVICELCHLRQFVYDGKGLRWRHTWLALDFGSGLLQSASELLISTMLIALAFGWTLSLTTDDSRLSHGLVGKLLAGLRRPAQLLNGFRSPALCLLLGIALAQLVLHALGRRFEEDFNNFHDHEHWPGLALLGIRMALCTIFAWAMRRSLLAETHAEVAAFLKQLFAYGLIWFFCLPTLVALAILLPPYKRHALVAGGSILTQTAALTLLSTLFLKRSRYYRISSLAHVGSVFETGLSAAKGKIAVD